MADLTITAASVVKGTNAKIEVGTAGATLTAGQAVYKDTADSGKFKPGDCNASGTDIRTVRGLALNGAASGQPVSVQYGGRITIGATVAVGTVYCLSGTAGGIRPVADNVSGDYVSLIGVAVSTTQIDIQIQNSGVSVP